MLTKRRQKRLLQLILGLLLLGISYYYGQSGNVPANIGGNVAPGHYRVIKVDDGDTITVDMNGRDERVRFIGVDTPETHDPRKPVQCFGRAASEFTKQLIGNNHVRLESDPLSANRDRYDRLLRHIYLPDDRLVQAEIIREGYGFALASFPFTKSDEFRQLERTAREQNKGLWSSCRPAPNQYGGYDSNPE